MKSSCCGYGCICTWCKGPIEHPEPAITRAMAKRLRERLLLLVGPSTKDRRAVYAAVRAWANDENKRSKP